MCIPDILDGPTLKKIREAIEESEFEDGRRTAGRYAKRVKHNLQLKRESEQAKRIKATIVRALRRNPTFHRVAIPRSIRPPLISCYREGMDYGLHVDDALMGRAAEKARTDLSVTVALNSPEDYDGGELVIHSPFGEQEVKLPAGAAVKLTTGAFAELAKPAGIGRAEAMRRSMLALMADEERPFYAHPMFWAPFIVVGEGGR